MGIFKAELDAKILRYAFIPINVLDEKQLLHYVSIVLPDFGAFSEFFLEFKKFEIDLYQVTVRNDYEYLNELKEILTTITDYEFSISTINQSHEDAVESRASCSSIINTMDVVSEVVYVAATETEVVKSKFHSAYKNEGTLDFSQGFPDLKYGPDGPQWVKIEGCEVWGMSVIWPDVDSWKPSTPEYLPDEECDQNMDVEFVLKRPGGEIERTGDDDSFVDDYEEASTYQQVDVIRRSKRSNIGEVEYGKYRYSHFYSKEEGIVVGRSAKNGKKVRMMIPRTTFKERFKYDISILRHEVFDTLGFFPPHYLRSGDVAICRDKAADKSRVSHSSS
jgi:hypothetical protein